MLRTFAGSLALVVVLGYGPVLEAQGPVTRETLIAEAERAPGPFASHADGTLTFTSHAAT